MRGVVISVLIFVGVAGVSYFLSSYDNDEESSRSVSADRWVEFEIEPTVCEGTLHASGVTVSTARFGGGAAAFVPFAMYRDVGSGSILGSGGSETIEPVLVFHEPLGPDEYYTDLEPIDQVATRLDINHQTGEFELQSEVPDWVVADPGEYTFDIWGYRRSGEPQEILRTSQLRTC